MTGAQILGLDGRPKDGANDIKSPDALTSLKALVAEIESGELPPLHKWVMLYEVESRTESGRVVANSCDSDLTIAEAVLLIEMAKRHWLNGMEMP